MNKQIKVFKQIINEMKESNSFQDPISLVTDIHHDSVHRNIHIPLSKEIKKLGFFVNKPTLKNKIATYDIGKNNRGNEILHSQLGIGKSLIPLPQHHHSNENSVRHLIDRAFSKKPSKYLNYLKTVYQFIENVSNEHKHAMVESKRNSIKSLKQIKDSVTNSFNNSVPIGSVIEEKQREAKHHSDVSYEHEKLIKQIKNHKVEIVKHARALGKIYGFDKSDKPNLESNKISFGVWDEVF